MLKALEPWLQAKLETISQKGELAEATRYAPSRWRRLARFLDDGRAYSNTLARVIRHLALNRNSASSLPPKEVARCWAVLASLTGTWFLVYVQQVLSPTLRRGDIVILDHLPVHKITSVRKAVEATGTRLLFLAPYSPDFDPTENAFSKLKVPLRKATARTVDGLWKEVASATFNPADCANYSAAAGYYAW